MKKIKFFKKIINYFFAFSPNEIVYFNKLKNGIKGECIDKPERLTQILYEEKGEINIIKPFTNSFNVPFVHKKINKELRYLNGGIFKEPDKVIYSLQNGCVFGNLGIIYDPVTNKVIDESAKEWLINLKEHTFFNTIRIKEAVYKQGVALSIATTGADGGFYHFISEAIIKLHFCRKILTEVDYILVPGDKANWKENWLLAANINLNKVIWLTNASHFIFDQLIFTNRLIYDQQFTNWSVNALKSLYKYEQVNALKQNRIIWSSRRTANYRNFLWEDKIKKYYPNIEFIDFSKLSSSQTIQICKETKFFLGPHGAGFSNLVFCNPNTIVLEIFPSLEFQPLYNRLSNKCNLNHFAIALNYDDENSEIGLKYFIDVFNEIFIEINIH